MGDEALQPERVRHTAALLSARNIVVLFSRLPASQAAEAGELPEDEPADLAPVEFVANEFFFVYVRVNGRVLSLEPRRRIQLAPGTYRVQLRVDKAEKWISAGRFEVVAGAKYRVEMKKPAGFNVVKK